MREWNTKAHCISIFSLYRRQCIHDVLQTANPSLRSMECGRGGIAESLLLCALQTTHGVPAPMVSLRVVSFKSSKVLVTALTWAGIQITTPVILTTGRNVLHAGQHVSTKEFQQMMARFVGRSTHISLGNSALFIDFSSLATPHMKFT